MAGRQTDASSGEVSADRLGSAGSLDVGRLGITAGGAGSSAQHCIAAPRANDSESS